MGHGGQVALGPERSPEPQQVVASHDGLPPFGRRLAVRILVVSMVAGGLVLGVRGLDHPAPAPEVAATSTGHVHPGGPITAESIAEMRAEGYRLLPGPDNMWEYQGRPPSGPGIDGPELEAQARAVVAERGWDRLPAAEADGFARLTDVDERGHYFNRTYLDDGITGDPTRPESLVYDRSGRLLAMMLMVPAGEHGQRVGGVDAAWHVHAVSLCFGDDLMMPTSLPVDGACPSGEAFRPWSSEMLHIWFEGETFASRMTTGSS